MTLLFKFSKVIGAALLIWLGLIVLIATPLLNYAVPRAVQQAGLQLQHGIFLIDPFRIRLMGEAIRVHDSSGAERIRIEDLEVDIDALGSLRRRAAQVSRLTVTGFDWRASEQSAAESRDSPQGQPGIRWAGLLIEQLVVDQAQQTLGLQNLHVDTPRLQAALTDSEINLSELWAGLLPETPGNAEASETPSETPWSLRLQQLSINGGGVRVATDQLASGALLAENLDVSVADFSWPAGGVGDATLETRLLGTADLRLNGSVRWEDGTGVGELALSDLPLTEFQPMLAAYTDGTLDAGTLTLQTSAQFAALSPTRIDADAAIDSLAVSPPDNDEAATAVERIEVSGIAVTLPAQEINVADITLSGVSTLLHIERGGSINLFQMLKDPPSGNDGPTEDEVSPTATPADPESPEWRIAIGRTAVRESTLDFRDDNLPVQFTARVEQLNGALAGFDTATDSSASWTATGVIEGYAPVTIEGALGHFSDPRNGEFRFRTRGVDLATLAPYSATYAGFPIERGVMELSLDYSVIERGVTGGNALRIEQLELGDRQDSDRQVVNLPLKTAVALLSDAAGVIDISLPVSGSLDDPEFHIWGAAARAAMTLISNAVTAPFRFLASLIGSDEALDHVPFNAGEAALSEPAIRVLADLATALTERPAIRIAVEPGLDPIGDVQAVAAQTLNDAMLKLGVSQLAIEERGETWQAALISLGGESGLDTADMDSNALYSALLDTFSPPLASLGPLANARAAAVKTHLVEVGNIDPQRIAVSPWRGAESPIESAAQLELSGG